MERRTTLVIDDARLAAAQEVLGTSGLKDTVDRALIEIVRADRRRRLAMRLASGEGLDTAEFADHRRRQRWQR